MSTISKIDFSNFQVNICQFIPLNGPARLLGSWPLEMLSVTSCVRTITVSLVSLVLNFKPVIHRLCFG